MCLQKKKNLKKKQSKEDSILKCFFPIFIYLYFICVPEERDNDATSTWSSKNILKQKINRKQLILANKKNEQIGYSKPQKTLINHDNEETTTQQSVKKIKQSDIVEQKLMK